MKVEGVNFYITTPLDSILHHRQIFTPLGPRPNYVVGPGEIQFWGLAFFDLPFPTCLFGRSFLIHPFSIGPLRHSSLSIIHRSPARLIQLIQTIYSTAFTRVRSITTRMHISLPSAVQLLAGHVLEPLRQKSHNHHPPAFTKRPIRHLNWYDRAIQPPTHQTY